MNAQDILNRAADGLESEEWGPWGQGGEEYPLPIGYMCAMFAMDKASELLGLSLEDDNEAHKLMCNRIGSELIVRWNDTPGRTKAEVIRALRGQGEFAS